VKSLYVVLLVFDDTPISIETGSAIVKPDVSVAVYPRYNVGFGFDLKNNDIGEWWKK
jgi:hypothetical protein